MQLGMGQVIYRIWVYHKLLELYVVHVWNITTEHNSVYVMPTYESCVGEWPLQDAKSSLALVTTKPLYSQMIWVGT